MKIRLVKSVKDGQGKVVVYFWGWARYRDIFPRTLEHLTEYCFAQTGFTGDPFYPNPNAIVKPRTENCERHNCYDQECPIIRKNSHK